MKRALLKIIGFTLTELMAVVVIIAILAGMSAGSFKQAIERSHFNEGFQAGAAVSEAVSRFHYDNLTKASNTRPQMSQLDLELSKWGECASSSNYCKKTRYFEIVIATGGEVRAFRTKKGVRTDYAIYFYPEFGSEHKLEECLYSNNSGKNLCVSMGYSLCASSVCSRSYGYYNNI